MEVDGPEEAPCAGSSSGTPPVPSSRSQGKSASFFLSKADECLSCCPPNFSLAVKFLEKGLSLHPDDVELLQRLAGEYADQGRTDEARGFLKRAIDLEPSSGPVKYLQLAQLEDGAVSLSLYTTGISLLESLLAASATRKPKPAKAKKHKNLKGNISLASENEELRVAAETKLQLVAAYCAVAELHLTDLCDEAAAETNAENAIKRALELQPDSPEALLCDAQLKKVRDDSESALASARSLLASIKAAQDRQFSASLLFSEEAEETEETHEGPSMELRVNACRLFVDVGMRQEAIELLKTCLEEDDEDPQVWLVLSCALFKSDDFDSTLHCLAELRERLKRCGIPSDHPMSQHERQLRDLAEKGLAEQQQQQQQQDSSSSDLSSSEDEGMDVA